VACESGTTFVAPIQIVGKHHKSFVHDTYIVQAGDTLYSVAWHFDMDYRILAQQNHLSKPYHLVHGQKLALNPNTSFDDTNSGSTQVVIHKIKRTRFVEHEYTIPTTTQPISSSIRWQWPVKGRLLHTFTHQNKGIDIVGKLGQSIMTTAPGVVVYAGEGIRGYGKLLIIKHNDDFLSAYAHNSKLLVKENDNIVAGQTIALMGNTGSDRVELHFELRHNGSPVNPLIYLGK
jgi:lipoprotein NlpD